MNARKPAHGGYPGFVEQIAREFDGPPRDPERIPEMLAELGHLWTKYPDQRLGQLLVNIAGEDPFFIEDDDMVEMIRNYPADQDA